MNVEATMEFRENGNIGGDEIGFRVKFCEIIFENVPNNCELIIDDRKLRLILIDVCKNVEKLINEEWPSIINLDDGV